MISTQTFSIFTCTQFIHCCRIIFRLSFLPPSRSKISACNQYDFHANIFDLYTVYPLLSDHLQTCLSCRQADRKYLHVINMISTQKFSIFTQFIHCCRIIFRLSFLPPSRSKISACNQYDFHTVINMISTQKFSIFYAVYPLLSDHLQELLIFPNCSHSSFCSHSSIRRDQALAVLTRKQFCSMVISNADHDPGLWFRAAHHGCRSVHPCACADATGSVLIGDRWSFW